MSSNKYYFFSYSCAKPCKNYDFYFVLIRNFVQTWFRIDTKMMRNFVQKCKLFRKRIYCFIETFISKFQLRFSTKISELLIYSRREM